MNLLKRKIDDYLIQWKNDSNKMPLIIKWARQIWKTSSIRRFWKENYKNFIEINFAFDKQYKDIFEQWYRVDAIIQAISIHDTNLKFIPGETLLFFDEMQECPNVATSLKSFREDWRYDVICSWSLMWINYEKIESNSVWNKIDYEMKSMDFEEFLWAKWYTQDQIEDLYQHMLNIQPLSQTAFNVFSECFKEFMVLWWMPAIIYQFVTNKNYSGILSMQKQIILDYEEDITKYAVWLDKTKILKIYREIPVFLWNDNKKFQVTKIWNWARNRDFVWTIDWLINAWIINISYWLHNLELPLKGNYEPNNYRLYFSDTGLLIGSLDDEVQQDLRDNKNFNTYKWAIYENIIGELLGKQWYQLYFYRNPRSSIEMDFFVRDSESLVPVEVKAWNSATPSLKKLIESINYPSIKYWIKLCNQNIWFNGQFFTFPHFLTWWIKRFLNEKNK